MRKNDSDGRLINAINSVKERTGVYAYLDITGRLNLSSPDGRAIQIQGGGEAAQVFGGGDFNGISGVNHAIVGRLTLIRTDARDILVSGVNYSHIGFHSAKVSRNTPQTCASCVGSLAQMSQVPMGQMPIPHKVISTGKALGLGLQALRVLCL